MGSRIGWEDVREAVGSGWEDVREALVAVALSPGAGGEREVEVVEVMIWAGISAGRQQSRTNRVAGAVHADRSSRGSSAGSRLGVGRN